MTQNDLVPGGNQPPLPELLQEETAALAKRRDELLAAVERAPTADENTAGKIADLARMLAACIKAAEDAHKERKAPFLRDGRLVDAAYKREIIEPLVSAKETLAASLARYQADAGVEQVRGELGGVSSLREEWDFEITDPKHLNLNALRDYISSDAVEKAVRAYVKERGEVINGISIFRTNSVTIR